MHLLHVLIILNVYIKWAFQIILIVYICHICRGFRKWWQSLPDKKRHYFIQSARKRRQEVAIFIGILCVCWYIYYWTHLQEAPVTKRERFIAFTDYQFDKIMEFNAEKVCFNIKIFTGYHGNPLVTMVTINCPKE